MRALLARLRGRSYVWLGVLRIALPFVLFLILPQITEPAPSERVESDSFSKGALGHALLYDALEESGWKVERLRQTPRRNRARGAPRPALGCAAALAGRRALRFQRTP